MASVLIGILGILLAFGILGVVIGWLLKSMLESVKSSYKNWKNKEKTDATN